MAAAREYWFRPKRYGYGAEPINWKGWAATVGYVVLVVAWTAAMIGVPSITSGEPLSGNILIWGVLLAILTLAFVLMCWVKTDGEWRWRWNKKE